MAGRPTPRPPLATFGSFSLEETAGLLRAYQALKGSAVRLPAVNGHGPTSVAVRPPPPSRSLAASVPIPGAADAANEAVAAEPSPRPAFSWADRLKVSLPTPKPADAEQPAPVADQRVDPQTWLHDLVSKFDPTDAPALAVEPRGLVNAGNMCFMHSILQPLVFCPPLLGLLRQLDPLKLSALKYTPLLEAVLWFVSEFRVLDAGELERWRALPASERLGAPLAPYAVHDAIRRARKDVGIAGRQEDAEEFLGFLLAILHDEFLEVHKRQVRSAAAAAATPVPRSDDATWVSVGKRNRLAITREVEGEAPTTPIAAIFGGKLASEVKSKGSKPSVTLQPFYALPLDITGNDVHTLDDALETVADVERIDDYIDPLTRLPVEATKRTLIEKLPQVLILQLKRFVYTSAGVEKVFKFVSYPPELTIPAHLLSATCDASRTRYRLSAVVYHHGALAQGGHYTCDVLHSDDEWLRMDDTNVTPVRLRHVIEHKDDREAYLLFYQACR